MAKKNFESSLVKLEKITAELEGGDLTLEASLKKFDEGIQLASFCNDQLNDARSKIEVLIEKDGELETVPYEGTDNNQ